MNNIKVSSLSFSYGKEGRLVLKDINMEVNAGEFVCILGHFQKILVCVNRMWEKYVLTFIGWSGKPVCWGDCHREPANCRCQFKKRCCIPGLWISSMDDGWGKYYAGIKTMFSIYRRHN